MIQIKTVQMKNFRGYKDETVNLEKQNGTFFFFGDNGSGKTTFINAINWCLYGDIAFNTIGDNQDVRTIGTDLQEPVEVSVIVDIQSESYKFLRTTAQTGQNSGALIVKKIGENGNWGVALNQYEAEAVIKKFLPRNIRNLFFLNGDNFSTQIFDLRNTSSLKGNIYNVSEISTIDSAIKHLQSVADVCVKDLDKSTKNYDKLQKLRDELKSAEALKDYCRKRRDESDQKVKEMTNEIKKFDRLVQDTQGARDVIQARDVLTANIEQLEAIIANDEADITDQVQKNYHKLILLDGINEYHEALEKAREDGKIPAPVDVKVTQRILDTGICICGHEITDKERKEIEALNEQARKADEKKFLSAGMYQFQNINMELNDTKYIVCDAVEDLDNKRAERAKLEKQLDEIKERLKDIDETKLPDNPEQHHDNLERKKEKYEIERREAAAKFIECSDDIKKINAEMQKLLATDTDSQKIAKLLSRVQNTIETMEKLKTAVENNIRNRIQKGVWETYSRILPDGQFKNIIIDEDYSFSLISKAGLEFSTDSLAVGEAKTLALSLIYTLSNDIGYSDAPLFIDNLFGAIQESHYPEIARFVQGLAQEKQIFITYLYVPNADIGTRASAFFDRDNIAQEFMAKKDNETGICSLIEEGK